jgi:hypothetical protein
LLNVSRKVKYGRRNMGRHRLRWLEDREIDLPMITLKKRR